MRKTSENHRIPQLETLAAEDQQACHALLKDWGDDELLSIRLTRRLTRVQNRMAVE